ncbi:MAG: amidohydrolase family protein [Thermomicrobiales bacterium]|nr:amidohydrolase family protein [Thermomicrobiales bacterium]
MSDLQLHNLVLPDGSRPSIRITDGRIATIDSSINTDEAIGEQIDLDGGLLLPAFIDGHVHLDKTYLGDAWHDHEAAASLVEHVANERQLRPRLASVEQRAAALIERALVNGTTIIRTHADIDPDAGLSNLTGTLSVRECFRDQVTIQVVAFPQSGILTSSGTDELLDEALRSGADLIGGLDPAGFDGDANGHLDVVFGLAERHGVGVDIHLHDTGPTGLAELSEIADRTTALGMQGRVTVGHAYALGTEPQAAVLPVAEALASAGVSIMTTAPGSHAFPPILMLREVGVNVFVANDNIRDCWAPYGDADMLERMMLVAYRSGFVTDAQLSLAFDIGTNAAAKALGIDGYGLNVGDWADFVVVDAEHIPEAVVARPPRRMVFRHGRLIARDGALVKG